MRLLAPSLLGRFARALTLLLTGPIAVSCGGDKMNGDASDGSGGTGGAPSTVITPQAGGGPSPGGEATGGSSQDENHAPIGSSGAPAQSTGGASTTQALSSCDEAGDVIFCDDFESYEVGDPPSGPWTVKQSAGGVEVTDAHAHGGAKSVHAWGAASEAIAAQMITVAPFPIAGAHFGRMMIFIEDSINKHVNLVETIGSDGSKTSLGVGGNNRIKTYYYGAGDHYVDSQGFAKNGAWVCAQWQYNAEIDSFRISIDGVELEEASIDGQFDLKDAQELRIGWKKPQSEHTTQMDLWVDDVVIDDSPVPCP